MSGRLCLITGASSGIGEALAHEYARAGWDLAITARRKERLLKLAETLAESHGIRVQPIIADLADPDTAKRILASLPQPADGLVNNAGYSFNGAMLEKPWEDNARFLRVMLTAPTELAHAVAPHMRERGFGRILNISSLLGMMPAMGVINLYAPIKSYLIRMSQALHTELKGTGVHVTAYCPSFTRTEIFRTAGKEEQAQQNIPGPFWQTSEEVARYAIKACEKNKAIATGGLLNRTLLALMMNLPDNLIWATSGRVAPKVSKPEK